MICLRALSMLTYLSCVRVGAIKMHRKIPVLKETVSYNRCFAWGMQVTLSEYPRGGVG